MAKAAQMVRKRGLGTRGPEIEKRNINESGYWCKRNMNEGEEAKLTTCYENYPFWIMVLSNCVSIAIYGIGVFILYQLGIIWLLIYLIYIAFLELRLLAGHCVDCYYYGKFCAFGKGKVSSLLFKKGEPQEFIQRQMSWKDILPDFLVGIVPTIAGIVILIRNFSWAFLALIFVLILFTFIGNALVRSSLACKYCRQREIGCPAERLFAKAQK